AVSLDSLATALEHQGDLSGARSSSAPQRFTKRRRVGERGGKRTFVMSITSQPRICSYQGDNSHGTARVVPGPDKKKKGSPHGSERQPPARPKNRRADPRADLAGPCDRPAVESDHLFLE